MGGLLVSHSELELLLGFFVDGCCVLGAGFFNGVGVDLCDFGFFLGYLLLISCLFNFLQSNPLNLVSDLLLIWSLLVRNWKIFSDGVDYRIGSRLGQLRCWSLLRPGFLVCFRRFSALHIWKNRRSWLITSRCRRSSWRSPLIISIVINQLINLRLNPIEPIKLNPPLTPANHQRNQENQDRPSNINIKLQMLQRLLQHLYLLFLQSIEEFIVKATIIVFFNKLSY